MKPRYVWTPDGPVLKRDSAGSLGGATAKSMHPERIKAALRMKGFTPTALADELGVANSSVSQVISGRTTSARIAGRIAQILGKAVDAIWAPKSRSLVRRKSSTRKGAK
jgi:lambda repressor-like predicted transcriptional regulator